MTEQQSIERPRTDVIAPTPITPRRRWVRALAPQRISALYFLLLVFVVFSIWVPDSFLAASTWRSLLNNESVVALVAIGFSIPMVAAGFDLAIGTEAGFAGVLVAELLTKQIPVALAIVIVLAVGALIGAVSGFLVVRARIDSFIATLGVSSVLTALTLAVSGGLQILNLPDSFNSISSTSFGVTVSVWVLIVLALIVYYVLERTPVGRRVYATGGNIEAARLAGVRTSRITMLSFIAGGAVAAVAGILETSFIGAGDPSLGSSYLLPALAGVFLGSTQFRGGRVNVWGTVIALYVLAAGTTGLQLAGAPNWIPDLFNGVALLVAVGVTKYRRGARTGNRFAVIRRVILRQRNQDGA